MSDLFKDHGPELSDDEDRRLWQRVRAIPEEAAGEAPRAVRRAPWWTRLWAMPAVRYGAPALAVLVIAVVWVTERKPESPAREAARMRELKASAPAPAAPELATREVTAPTTDATQRTLLSKEKANPAERQEAAPAPEPVAALKAGAKNEESGLHVRGGRADETHFAVEPLAEDKKADETRQQVASVKDQVAPPPPAAATPAPAAARSAAGSTWGALKSQYRDSGSPTPKLDELSADRARHALVDEVAEVATLGPLTATVAAPAGDLGLSAGESITLELSPAGGSLVRIEGVPGMPWAKAPARVQAAVLAALLEREQASPGGASRARLESLRTAALRIDPGAGGQGRSRVLAALDGALGATPVR